MFSRLQDWAHFLCEVIQFLFLFWDLLLPQTPECFIQKTLLVFHCRFHVLSWGHTESHYGFKCAFLLPSFFLHHHPWTSWLSVPPHDSLKFQIRNWPTSRGLSDELMLIGFTSLIMHPIFCIEMCPYFSGSMVYYNCYTTSWETTHYRI